MILKRFGTIHGFVMWAEILDMTYGRHFHSLEKIFCKETVYKFKFFYFCKFNPQKI